MGCPSNNHNIMSTDITTEISKAVPKTSPITTRPLLRRMTDTGPNEDTLKNESYKEAAKQARIADAKAPAPPSPLSSSKDFVQELAELGKLFQEGLLSESEFKKAKARLL